MAVVCACVGTAYGGAKKIRFFTPTQAQIDESLAALGPDADPDGMAILNYAAGADKTIVQIIVSDMTPLLTYSLRLTDGTNDVVVSDAFTTDEDGHGTFHQEFPAADISTYNVELFVSTTGAGVVWFQPHVEPPEAQGSNWNTQNIADDVEFDSETSITSLRWWGGTFSGTDVQTFRVRFYADDGTGMKP
ncbi:MAG: hypothetical protein IID40_10405, partial [Planctomycetes bacterium]|nr:hypothetical protein [Planctomycetota bacterium]